MARRRRGAPAAPQRGGFLATLSGLGWKGWLLIGGILVAILVAGMFLFCEEESPADSSSLTSTGGGSGVGGVEDAASPGAPLGPTTEDLLGPPISGPLPPTGGGWDPLGSINETRGVTSPSPGGYGGEKKSPDGGKGVKPDPSSGRKGGKPTPEVEQLRKEHAQLKGSAAWGKATTLALWVWGLWLFFLSLLSPLDRWKRFGKPAEFLIFGIFGVLVGGWTLFSQDWFGDMPGWVWWVNAVGGGIATLIGILASPKGGWKWGLIGLLILSALTTGAYLFFRYAPVDWYFI